MEVKDLFKKNEEENKIEVEETYIEKKVAKSRDRRIAKGNQEYQQFSQTKNKVALKVFVFILPMFGTISGVIWTLLKVDIDQATKELIIGILVSTMIGNIIAGIASVILTDNELNKAELDMYNSCKMSHLKQDVEMEHTQKDYADLQDKYNKLDLDTTQLRKENEERLFKIRVDEEVAKRNKELERRIEEELKKKVQEKINLQLNSVKAGDDSESREIKEIK